MNSNFIYSMLKSVGLLLAVMTLSGCDKSPDIEPNVTRVTTYALPVVDNSVIREFNGVARAQDLTNLSFRVGGRIAQIPASKGKQVEKGDLLAILEKTDFEIALSDRRARMEVNFKQSERGKQLVAKQLMAQSDYDQMNAQYLVAKAEARQAELNLQYTELRAPFSGVISDVFLESFENVQPGVPVVSIQKIERIEVDVQIPDMLIAVSKKAKDRSVGALLEVSFEAFPNATFDGHLLEVNTEKDPATSTYIATIAVDLDPKYKVLEGMPAKVKVDLSHLTYTYNRQFLVPIEAVIMQDGSDIEIQDSGVWLFDKSDQSIQYQHVTLGVIVGDRIEVIDGLKDGQVIIQTGASRLVAGQKVQVVGGV
ncbi:efflux RND transporter periplasmic adaptor subunit [Shewanella sp. 3_MG-2023]|uniref:efflux RND transporter periplasmic adaptor subunit n=1 Tax=Shewanella sp. 3_MG-2023 TaxID=3062635 RepID=UPI0026E29B85|nr:efflux RND transporter periplasmic adaptor subunit [Shewanella sp. 3_MG-2023]MDO6774148.1 efflux RND transporter periplasmic adaptor subunit [Shewanella sp. 3_MG-2023]